MKKPSALAQALIDLIEASPSKHIRLKGCNFRRYKTYKSLMQYGYTYAMGGDTWLKVRTKPEGVFDHSAFNKSMEFTPEPVLKYV